ncbi:MAG: phage tail protein [Chthonomonadaceae bacterium]|nr:phage tail protein [Chthonomonadaceae bacterium]
MSKPFSVNTSRFDPYKAFAFRVYFGDSTAPVAGVSKVSALTRTTGVIAYQEGNNAVTRQGMGRTKYNPITMERGVTHDDEFEAWANAAQVLDKGAPTQSLKKLRKNIRIELLNEEGQPVHRYLVYNCWVSEFQALPQLDAGSTGVAIEHVILQNEGWEHDLSLSEPTEQ